MYGKVTNGNFGYYLPAAALTQLKSLKHLGIAENATISSVTLVPGYAR